MTVNVVIKTEIVAIAALDAAHFAEVRLRGVGAILETVGVAAVVLPGGEIGPGGIDHAVVEGEHLEGSDAAVGAGQFVKRVGGHRFFNPREEQVGDGTDARRPVVVEQRVLGNCRQPNV